MSSYTFTTNIPLSTDDPSVSQSQVLTNFNSTNSIVNVDMIGFNLANGGYHSKVTFVDQTSSPPTGVTGADVIYSAVSNSILELYLQRTTGSPIQLTRGGVSATGNATTPPASGYTFLPGGILIQWGSVLGNTSGTGAAIFTFPVAFNNIFSIVGNVQAGAPQAFTIKSVSVTGAVAVSSAGPQTINYIAIGN